MWVAVFGLVEIAIGAGMLFRRTVKGALRRLLHLGRRPVPLRRGLRDGPHRPHLTSCGRARRRVLLRAARSVGVAEGGDRPSQVRVGVDSSAAGRGVFGGTGALLVWAAIWLFEAIIWMFPANRTGNAVPIRCRTPLPGSRAGTPTSCILRSCVYGSRRVGRGPPGRGLHRDRPRSVVSRTGPRSSWDWASSSPSDTGSPGKGLGELLTFGGTDPNNGPIVALIGLSILPLVPARGRTARASRTAHGDPSGRRRLGGAWVLASPRWPWRPPLPPPRPMAPSSDNLVA